MKKILLPLLLFSGLMTGAQAYNNEWINYSRTYYKFKVGSTGFYRISQPVLAALGIGSTAAEQFQLWRNGREVPLYTTVQTGPMSASDYIEFWGEMNDGKPDSILYRVLDFQLNDKWSLETDTAAFYLTINPGGGNLRLVPAANSLPSALPIEPFFISTVGKYYKEKINPGYAAVVGEYVYSSAYDQGEGYTSTDLGTGGARTENIPYLSTYTGPGAPAPLLKVNATGNALNPRDFSVKVNGNQVASQTMDFFDYVKANIPIAVSDISSGSAAIEIKNNCLSPNDRMAIARIELTYARTFNFPSGDLTNNISFELPANAAGNYLEITGFNYGTVNPVVFDFTNGKRYVCDISNPAIVKVQLDPSATTRKLLLASQDPAVMKAVTSLQQKNFINYSLAANQGNYLIISHPALTTGPGGSNPVEDYRAYRNSAVGGDHTAKIYMIDELVDQFGFGIKRNPLAVRNFIRFARNTFGSLPKNVLLIGKGANYVNNRSSESNPNIDLLSFIPTWGSPASDMLFAADPGLDETPKISIGRISAINGGEVALYLAKVIQYEQQQALQSPLIADKAWMKNVVHAVGASDPSLGIILQTNMNKYTQTAADTLYGGNVNTFSKVSAAPIEQASSAKLSGLFQDGISIVTYFGHSSATTLEFNLDNPDQYNNPGKYPMMMVLGCNAGNFFGLSALRLQTRETLSEKFVLAPQRGSVAYIASTHLGIVHYLDIYSTKFYNALSTTHYGKTLGELMNETVMQVYNLTTQNDYYARFHCEQQTLHGDPALRLDVSMPKPDYVIEDQLVKISPQFISVAETHFKVDAKMMNLGRAPNKSIVVELKRTYPDLTTEVVRRDTIPGIRYMDSLTYDLPIVPTRDKGLNKISICVDADNEADELYETNNCITKDVFVYEDEARPVYPYNYAIVKDPGIKLFASTANPFSGLKNYTMEMDTTELFNSPFKISRSVTSTGGVLEFNPGISFSDSTVYYWRVAYIPSSGQPTWNKSSFIYLSSSGPNASDYGFNQSHFHQQTKSAYNRIIVDTAARRLQFGSVFHNLFLRMGTWISSGATQESSLALSVDGASKARLTCWFSSLVFNVLNPVTFDIWQNQTITPANYPTYLGEGLLGSTAVDCFGQVRRYNFEYRYTDTASRRKIMNMMRDSIPDGYYVVVRNFTLDPVAFPTFPIAWAAEWAADTALYGSGQSLYHYLKNAGFSGVDSFYRARPFGLVYKKNDPSFTPRWVVGQGTFDNPTLNVDCPTPDTLGFVTSPLFGPAKAWKQLKWRGSGDANAFEDASVDVIGVQADGSEATLYSNLSTSQQDFDVSSINPVTYPFVKLKLRTRDTSKFTPYQLRYWRITYTPVPEGAIAANLYLKVKDSVDVGEPLDYKIAFKNISDAPFDSLKVKLVVTDKNNVQHIVPIPKRRPLLVNDTLQIGALINTSTIPGHNTTFLEANPDNDQLEQYHFNNFAFRSLYVKPDSLNPLLDVTFDGVHILNRDIVASKPDIIIKLKDEARWMILDDTALLTLQVRYPPSAGGQLRRFYFNNDTVRFTPAGQAPNPDNTAMINFKPYFAADGEYEMIVTGKDRSNNAAGNIQYRVLFNVINKPMISNMLNYPNPFTTSTAFVFTITGSEVPQNIKIEIMTITGKIVREITKDELGPLHVGQNITEFKWDGTDQYGQKLANGVYIYRVVTNLNGKSLDNYNGTNANGEVISEGINKTDKFFNKGYGKMYLMR
ncbi:MAG: hypothetical protein HZB42_12530 [Sphingobacteriales bacterium]|nr:hypothetical protein [Sphingobacteriales bacterium]